MNARLSLKTVHHSWIQGTTNRGNSNFSANRISLERFREASQSRVQSDRVDNSSNVFVARYSINMLAKLEELYDLVQYLRSSTPIEIIRGLPSSRVIRVACGNYTRYIPQISWYWKQSLVQSRQIPVFKRLDRNTARIVSKLFGNM